MKEEQAKATPRHWCFHTHPPCAVWCLSLRSRCKRRVHLASGVSHGAAWCWAGAQIKGRHRQRPCTIGRSLSSTAMSEVLSFTYLIKPNRNRTVWRFWGYQNPHRTEFLKTETITALVLIETFVTFVSAHIRFLFQWKFPTRASVRLRECGLVPVFYFNFFIFILWGGTRSLRMPALRPASQAGPMRNPREDISVVLRDTIRLTWWCV